MIWLQGRTLTRSGSIRFLKGDSPFTVSSFIYYPSFSAYGKTHSCAYACTRPHTLTLTHTHPLVKAISSLDQDGVQHLYFDPQREKPSVFFPFTHFFLPFVSTSHNLLHLLAGCLCHLLFRFRCSSSISRYFTSVACCCSSNQQ